MKLGEVKESNGHDLGRRMVGEEKEDVESSRAIRGSWWWWWRWWSVEVSTVRPWLDYCRWDSTK